MKRFLCKIGFHKWSWYSYYDKSLYKMGQNTGPLTECRLCGFHQRIENGQNGYINADKIEHVLKN